VPPPRKIITGICYSPLDAQLLQSQYFHISKNSDIQSDIQDGQSYCPILCTYIYIYIIKSGIFYQLPLFK